MSELPSGFSLAEGETLIMKIDAALMVAIYNPLLRLIVAILKFIAMILGFRTKGFLIITDRRVVEVWEHIGCWCINLGRQVSYVKPNSIKEVGFEKRTTCGCFCPVYCLYYKALTRHTAVKMKGADESTVLKTVEAFYTAIEHAKE
jgi:hypothetical protein